MKSFCPSCTFKMFSDSSCQKVSAKVADLVIYKYLLLLLFFFKATSISSASWKMSSASWKMFTQTWIVLFFLSCEKVNIWILRIFWDLSYTHTRVRTHAPTRTQVNISTVNFWGDWFVTSINLDVHSHKTWHSLC